MPLNTSGPISLGGATTGQSINLELGQSATQQVSLNDTNVRSLAGISVGAITMPIDFYGKSSSINQLIFFGFNGKFINGSATSVATFTMATSGNEIYFALTGPTSTAIKTWLIANGFDSTTTTNYGFLWRYNYVTNTVVAQNSWNYNNGNFVQSGVVQLYPYPANNVLWGAGATSWDVSVDTPTCVTRWKFNATTLAFEEIRGETNSTAFTAAYLIGRINADGSGTALIRGNSDLRWVWQFNTNFQNVGMRYYTGSSNNNTNVGNMVFSASGDCYFGGWVTTGGARLNRFTGSTAQRTLDFSSLTSAFSLATVALSSQVSTTPNVYAGLGVGTNFHIRCYDHTLTTLNWGFNYSGYTSLDNFVLADSLGNIYTVSRQNDIVKYSSLGAVLWARRIQITVGATNCVFNPNINNTYSRNPVFSADQKQLFIQTNGQFVINVSTDGNIPVGSKTFTIDGQTVTVTVTQFTVTSTANTTALAVSSLNTASPSPFYPTPNAIGNLTGTNFSVIKNNL